MRPALVTLHIAFTSQEPAALPALLRKTQELDADDVDGCASKVYRLEHAELGTLNVQTAST